MRNYTYATQTCPTFEVQPRLLQRDQIFLRRNKRVNKCESFLIRCIFRYDMAIHLQGTETAETEHDLDEKTRQLIDMAWFMDVSPFKITLIYDPSIHHLVEMYCDSSASLDKTPWGYVARPEAFPLPAHVFLGIEHYTALQRHHLYDMSECLAFLYDVTDLSQSSKSERKGQKRAFEYVAEKINFDPGKFHGETMTKLERRQDRINRSNGQARQFFGFLIGLYQGQMDAGWVNENKDWARARNLDPRAVHLEGDNSQWFNSMYTQCLAERYRSQTVVLPLYSLECRKMHRLRFDRYKGESPFYRAAIEHQERRRTRGASSESRRVNADDSERHPDDSAV